VEVREVAITTTMRISSSADLGLTSQLIQSLQMTNQASRIGQGLQSTSTTTNVLSLIELLLRSRKEWEAY